MSFVSKILKFCEFSLVEDKKEPAELRFSAGYRNKHESFVASNGLDDIAGNIGADPPTENSSNQYVCRIMQTEKYA